MTRKFYQRFPNLDIDASKAQKRFMTRMLYHLFPEFPTMRLWELQLASKALGERIPSPPHLEKMVLMDFHSGLYMIVNMFNLFTERDSINDTQNAPTLSDHIQKELEAADIDLGIEWRDGEFIPRGARLLDEKLVDDPLDWLKNSGQSTVYDPFTKALDHLLRARKDPRLLNDAITDAHEALEAMVRVVCENDKIFDANREQYISKINASQEFKRIAKELSQYAHEFRHAAIPEKPKPKPTMDEVEAYIYTVGILIRMGTKTLDQRSRENGKE